MPDQPRHVSISFLPWLCAIRKIALHEVGALFVNDASNGVVKGGEHFGKNSMPSMTTHMPFCNLMKNAPEKNIQRFRAALTRFWSFVALQLPDLSSSEDRVTQSFGF